MTDKRYATFAVTVEANVNWETDWFGTRDPAVEPEQGSEEHYKGLLYRLCKADYLANIPIMMSHMHVDNDRLKDQVKRLAQQIDDLKQEVAQAGRHT
jgi:hypothetical protein